MGHTRKHQFTLAARLFDVFSHLIEGAVHLGHFAGRVADRQAHTTPLTQLASCIHQTLEGLIELADENPRRSGG